MVKNLFVAFIFILFLFPRTVLGQRTIGIDWHVPATVQTADSELTTFSGMDISYLQIHQNLDQKTWERVDKLGFTVFAMLPLQFPVSQNFAAMDSSSFAQIQRLSTWFNAQSSVGAIGIFEYGDENDAAFEGALKKLIYRLKPRLSKKFYFTSTRPQSSSIDTLFDFKMLSISTPELVSEKKIVSFLYRPDYHRPWALAPVKNILRQTTLFPDQPLFFSSLWLKKMLVKHPHFNQTISLYTHSKDADFPLPQREPSVSSGSSLIALMLLLLWIIFAATYNFNPLYRNSLLRYFTGHTFFVNDVMKRHIRNLFTGFSILIQHCISGGIVLYCLFSTVFTALGREAIFTHYPFIAEFGTGKLAFFMWGVFITFLLEICAVLWLWLANPKATTLSQIFNLYPWPLQLNLIIATLMAALFLPNGNAILIYMLAIVFVLLFNCGFIVTSFDTARYISTKRGWYLAGTLGLYLILLAGITFWITTSPALQNIIHLAVSLP